MTGAITANSRETVTCKNRIMVIVGRVVEEFVMVRNHGSFSQ
jgi:hypothetical protein